MLAGSATAAALLVLAVARALPTLAVTVAATLPPSDPRIRYFGRVDHTDPQQPKFAWVMTGAACTFNTTGAATVSASFIAPKDGARVRVMIDGELAGFVKVQGGPDRAQVWHSVAGDPAGYSCAVNKNYEGEKTCFKKGCPLTGISTLDVCAGHCNSTEGCTVIVHNSQGECYLKSDYSTSLLDDPSEGTVSCTTTAGHHPPPSPGPVDSYTLGSVTAAGTHTLELFKVTEDNSRKGNKGTMSFGGFSLSGGGSFGAAPASATRRLEFIGDSDTAGWCADGSSSGGDNADKYQDGYQTWAMQIARNVSAEFMVEAVSGFGVEPSTPAIQPVMDYTLGFDSKGGLWNYSSWVPDAVVILIGPNDEVPMLDQGQFGGAAAGRGGSKFIKDYLQLLTQVANNYRGVPVPPKIVHVCGGKYENGCFVFNFMLMFVPIRQMFGFCYALWKLRNVTSWCLLRWLAERPRSVRRHTDCEQAIQHDGARNERVLHYDRSR
jgi:hypothetical protein